MRPRILLRQVVVLSTVAGLLAWLAVTLGNDVTIRVDGHTIDANTNAGTVVDVLADADVAVDRLDRVEPPLDAAVADGTEIRVTRAVPVTLRLDGIARERLRVPAETVSDVVRAAGLAPISGLSIVPAPDTLVRPGMIVTVRRPIEVTVVADGREHHVRADAPTVGSFLGLAGIELGPDDELSPSLGRSPHDGMRIEVRRVAFEEVVEEVALPYDERRRETDELTRGDTRVVQEGAEGLRRDTFRVRMLDGVEVAREKVAEEVVREPQPRIVEIGTREPQPCCASDGSSQTGSASWYDSPHGAYTAAHRTLSIGTVVTVTNLANGASVRVRIADRGPFVDGRVIDLERVAFGEIASLSTGVIRVRVTW